MLRSKVKAEAGKKGKKKGKDGKEGHHHHKPKSNVEKLAKRVDDRFHNRMDIILPTRIAFVEGCREYAVARKGDDICK